MEKGSNYTTILGEISPEMESQIRRMPRRSTELPPNVYSEPRLLTARCAIRRVSSEPDFSMPLHIHDFHVFTYCRQAEGYEYLVDTKRYQLHNSDLLHIPPGVPHRPIATERAEVPFVRDELWLRNDFIRSFGKRLPEASVEALDYLFRGNDPRWEKIDVLFQQGVAETENKEFRWDTMIDGYASIMLVSISRVILDGSIKSIPPDRPNLFDRVVAYLKENLDKKLIPEDIAAQFFVSKSTLNRAFRKHMGTSFYHGVIQLRLLAAQQMIMDGMLLENVSRRVGFADYPTFYRAFRKECGISPKQFRQTYFDQNSVNSPKP